MAVDRDDAVLVFEESSPSTVITTTVFVESSAFLRRFPISVQQPLCSARNHEGFKHPLPFWMYHFSLFGFGIPVLRLKGPAKPRCRIYPPAAKGPRLRNFLHCRRGFIA